MIESVLEKSDSDPSAGESGKLARKAAHGAAALMVRQGLVYGANIAGGITLARLLPPAEFGFYGVILFLVAFLNIFGGTGFAANLIRTDRQPSIQDFRAVFTGQQALVAIVCSVIWVAAPWLAAHYDIQHNGSAFFRLIAVALALTSMMVVPQVMMERELAFGKLAVVEVVQATIFNLVAVVLAWRKVGVLSFAIALAARAGSGALLSNLMEPWPMGWLWDISTLKRHIRFGVALQAGQFISMVKDSITPVFVGLYLGPTKMGYVTWATTLAGYPTMILTPLQRLYLPFFACLQGDRNELRRYADRAIWITNAIAAPLVVSTIVLARPITEFVFGNKWILALPVFYCLAIANVFASGSAPLLGLLNAIGKSHLTLLLAITWMVTTWAFGVPLMIKFGVLGFGIAVLAVQITNLGLYWAVWREISLSVLPAFWPCWPLAAIIGAGVLGFQLFVPIRGLASLSIYGLIGSVVYLAVLWVWFPVRTRSLARMLRRAH